MEWILDAVIYFRSEYITPMLETADVTFDRAGWLGYRVDADMILWVPLDLVLQVSTRA
jgi:hypothetical protein